jgi:glutaredoxin
MFPAFNLKPEEMEVVRLNGAQMKIMEYVDKLANSPPNKTPPYVFIDGAYLGGWPELQRRHQAKELAPLLLNPGAEQAASGEAV